MRRHRLQLAEAPPEASSDLAGAVDPIRTCTRVALLRELYRRGVVHAGALPMYVAGTTAATASRIRLTAWARVGATSTIS